MDPFLREIKNITDSLAAISSPLANQELVQYTIDSLDDQYEVFVTVAAYFGGHLTFDELCTKLIVYEPWVTHLRESSNNTTSHQALATSIMASPHFHNSRNAPNSNNSRRGRGGHWRGNRSNLGRNGGRDRGSNNTSGCGTQHQSSPSSGQGSSASSISSCSSQYVGPTTIDTSVSPINMSPDVCSNLSPLPKLLANFASPHITLPLIVLVTSLLLPKLAPLQDRMLSPLSSLMKLTMLSGTLTRLPPFT